jgi:hypothetical protein
MLLLPGAAHPHPRRTPSDLAAWLGVPEARVSAWIATGLPAPGGLIDSFEAVNWLNQRITEVPALAARWRRYLRWFSPFVQGRDRPARRGLTRHHRLYLPAECAAVRWWLPHLSGEQWSVPVTVQGGSHVMLEVAAASATAVVACRPSSEPQAEFIPVMEELVAGFTYGYRHHRPDDLYLGRTSGSCLDLALALGERVAACGRPWRLCSGVVAHTALANPHFWIEIEIASGGWATLDPSLPLIARTFSALGVVDDWRDWVRAYCGGCDARRITLCRGEAPVRGIPGGATLGSTIGEVVVETQQGQANAWPCLDWVCGECRWEFD